MNDQKQHWNELHIKGAMKVYAKKQTDFANEAIRYFPTKAEVLELGCGLGNDSFFFAKQGHNDLATDFSDAVIKQNNNMATSPSPTFGILRLWHMMNH